jgi:hypothetical protein
MLGCGSSTSPRGCPRIQAEPALDGRKESLPWAVFVCGGRDSGSMIGPRSGQPSEPGDTIWRLGSA